MTSQPTSSPQLEVWISSAPKRAITHTLATLGPVLTLPEHERTQLLDALRAWLTEDTTKRAAARAGCDPSTLKRRLDRIDTLTGLRRHRPKDAAELWIALESLRLFGDDQNDPGALVRLMGKFADHKTAPTEDCC